MYVLVWRNGVRYVGVAYWCAREVMFELEVRFDLERVDEARERLPIARYIYPYECMSTSMFACERRVNSHSKGRHSICQDVCQVLGVSDSLTEIAPEISAKGVIRSEKVKNAMTHAAETSTKNPSADLSQAVAGDDENSSTRHTGTFKEASVVNS